MKAKRQKGKNPYLPPLPVLLRDAEPTWAEIAGESDARARVERERARDIARDELLRMHAEAKKHGRLNQLDRDVCRVVARLTALNGGKTPKPKGGCPSDPHHRMMIFLAADAEVRANNGKNIVDALKRVAERNLCSYSLVRSVFYDKSEDWLRAVRIEMAIRTRRINSDPDSAPPTAGSER